MNDRKNEAYMSMSDGSRHFELILNGPDGSKTVSATDAYYMKPQDKPKWQESACGDCGYFWSDIKSSIGYGCRKYESKQFDCDAEYKACPDFTPR